MRQSIYIEGNSDAATSLLLHFSILLAQHRLIPEYFAWHVSSNRDVKLFLLLVGQQETLSAFTEECRHQVGVQYLWQGTIPENGILAQRIGELADQLRRLCEFPGVQPEAG